MEYVEMNKDAQFVSMKVRVRAEIGKEESGLYSSYCPALHVWSQGETYKEAKGNLVEAIQLMIEVHLEDGSFDQWMKKQGFHTFSAKRPLRSRKAAKIPPPNVRTVNIPVEFPLAAYC